MHMSVCLRAEQTSSHCQKSLYEQPEESFFWQLFCLRPQTYKAIEEEPVVKAKAANHPTLPSYPQPVVYHSMNTSTRPPWLGTRPLTGAVYLQPHHSSY
ncbi:hypothetical protein M408DRAFT_331743 [Serendipita vermifera MAFF 305830]|uniref:Uncharacterized protein n=1 Tax=Serendipita vermifera MAFF 305830 TaxID=933852 RepID=A0A0C3AIQ7_SERVB|nr:hypothetical protein M408DRAFT_331743 [Serendipita vermifera MAFF 305830]